jgi:hypothetical protein
LNRKEISRKEEDVIDVHNSQFLTVHEPKLKVPSFIYLLVFFITSVGSSIDKIVCSIGPYFYRVIIE